MKEKEIRSTLRWHCGRRIDQHARSSVLTHQEEDPKPDVCMCNSSLELTLEEQVGCNIPW